MLYVQFRHKTNAPCKVAAASEVSVPSSFRADPNYMKAEAQRAPAVAWQAQESSSYSLLPYQPCAWPDMRMIISVWIQGPRLMCLKTTFSKGKFYPVSPLPSVENYAKCGFGTIADQFCRILASRRSLKPWPFLVESTSDKNGEMTYRNSFSIHMSAYHSCTSLGPSSGMFRTMATVAAEEVS